MAQKKYLNKPPQALWIYNIRAYSAIQQTPVIPIAAFNNRRLWFGTG